MNIKTFTLFFLAIFMVAVQMHAQQRDCGTMEYLEQQIQENPERALRLQEIEEHTKNILNNPDRVVNGIITIPVVVHVVFNVNNPSENITDAQIQSQIDILNEDFRRMNADAANTPAMFQGVAADSEIEFCLADIDPNGNPTDGITRTPTTVTSFSTNNNVKFDASGGHDAWPAADYMNFWICDLFGGLLGYAQFPGGPASTDGIVCDYQYVGDIGTATFPFHLGRTATHEVGHWLNLRHIWGDGGCGVDDFVSDTPLAGGSNTNGLPCTFPGGNSCNTGANDQPDMFQNYMDYSDDGCMNIFTLGQRDRMRALFDTGGFRESILSSTACSSNAPTCSDGIQNGNETGIDCGGPDCPPCISCNDGIQNGDEDGVDCGGSFCPPCISCNDGIQNGDEDGVDCGGSFCLPCISCNDGIQNGDEEGVDCGGSFCPPCFTCNDNDLSLNIKFDLLPNQVTWQFVDAGGNVIASGGPYDQSYAGNTVTEDICVTDGCYEFTIFDSGNDGLCCRFGVGGYELVDDATGNILVSGAQYGASEQTTVCLGASGGPTCFDGQQNGNETGVDCGGPDCPPCITCSDGIQNGDEEGVDCGGSFCPPCPPVPTCNDGQQNGNETGVDCGGPDCPPCPPTPTCSDGIQNGNETGVDCGGPDCPPCPGGCDFELVLQMRFDNHPEQSSWEITNSAGQVLHAGGPYPDETPNSFFIVDGLCLDAGCYDFTMFDSGGNGMCCADGSGKYRLLSTTGLTLASGAVFGDSETTNFCLGNGQRETADNPLASLSWDVFPIPTKEELTVRCKVPEASAGQLMLTNLTGEIIKMQDFTLEAGLNETTINTRNLAAGVYFVHLNQNGQRETKRFIVVK